MSIFGLLTLSNKYFPFAMVGMDLIMGGPSSAACSLTGIISGYLWWYLVYSDESGRPLAGYGSAPGWMRRVLGEGSRRVNVRGNVIRRGGHSWGSGRRLDS